MNSTLLEVREESGPYIPHDQLFKQLIGTFFSEFIELFFPEVYEHIDFSEIKPLSDELFTDLIEGESRKADIVVEATLKGEETLIIIHVEPQSYPQEDFHQRMYQYFSLLYNRYRKPILPIALFSYNQIREEPNQFHIRFPIFHVLTFSFMTVELKKLNWRTFLKSKNPVAAALLSKMEYKESEKLEVKKEFLRMVLKLDVNPAKVELINGFFESYLPIKKYEEESLMNEMKEFTREELDFIRTLPNSWRDRGLREGREQGIKEGKKVGEKQGMEEGMEKGMEKGIKKGVKTSIINYLELRFTSLISNWKEQIDDIDDLDVLQELQRDLYRTASKEEIEDLMVKALEKQERK